MIKALIFDFGQTLVDSADAFRTAEKEAKERLFARLDSEPDGPSWDAFLSRYRSIRKEFHRCSNFSRKAIWQAVCQAFNHKPDLNRFEKWENEYWAQVGSRTHPFPETVSVLEELSRRYQLSLVTNTQGQKNSENHRLALFPQLEKFFQVIIVAGESGIPPKPDLEPFRLCLEQLKILPHEAVFIGDDWRIDICGAREAGIQPIWLRHHSVTRNWPDVETHTPIITSLDELHDLVPQQSIASVDLPGGYHGKVLLVQIVGGRADGLVCLRSGDDWHREILRNAKEEIQDLGFENADVVPLGGAWVQFEPEGTITVYGSSEEFGPCDKKLAADLISHAFPGNRILTRHP